MTQLLRFWLALCLLRAAPQDMPASNWVLGFSVVCYTFVSVLGMALSYGVDEGLRVALLDVGLLAAFVVVLLYLTDKGPRIRQTLAALTGAGALLGVPALLLALATGPEQGTVQRLSLLWLLLLVWNLLVTAHILRHALSASLALGLGAALLYVLISTQVVVAVFPHLTAQ